MYVAVVLVNSYINIVLERRRYITTIGFHCKIASPTFLLKSQFVNFLPKPIQI